MLGETPTRAPKLTPRSSSRTAADPRADRVLVADGGENQPHTTEGERLQHLFAASGHAG